MRTPRNLGLSVLLLIALLGLWQFVVVAMNVPDYIVPAPSDVLVALYRGLARGLYLKTPSSYPG
jgi:NitT/TauT family transport system permease protein